MISRSYTIRSLASCRQSPHANPTQPTQTPPHSSKHPDPLHTRVQKLGMPMQVSLLLRLRRSHRSSSAVEDRIMAPPTRKQRAVTGGETQLPVDRLCLLDYIYTPARAVRAHCVAFFSAVIVRSIECRAPAGDATRHGTHTPFCVVVRGQTDGIIPN